MALKIKHTNIFLENFNKLYKLENGKYIYNEKYRYIINQGGTRSSKTYSLVQLIITYCVKHPNKIISIVRGTMPTLRGTVMKDFFDVLDDLDLYDVKRHNKTSNFYKFPNGSIVEFFATDTSQKIKGRKRDILWMNEADEISFEQFLQLKIRTTEKIFIDFNPSDSEHWIYDLLIKDNATLIKSSYKDNPFLKTEQIQEIESLIETDENYYKVYVLGERPIPQTRIYNHFKSFDELPSKIDEVIYGMDFGFNHPTTLIKVSYSDNMVYVEEVFYKTSLTSSDIVREMDLLNIDKRKYIFADYSRPEIIEDLRRSGYNMKNSNKDVKPGIDSVKSTQIFLDKKATNIWKEYKMYSWKTNGEIILDEPVKLYDDALDALRYAIHSNKKTITRTPFRIS